MRVITEPSDMVIVLQSGLKKPVRIASAAPGFFSLSLYLPHGTLASAFTHSVRAQLGAIRTLCKEKESTRSSRWELHYRNIRRAFYARLHKPRATAVRLRRDGRAR